VTRGDDGLVIRAGEAASGVNAVDGRPAELVDVDVALAPAVDQAQVEVVEVGGVGPRGGDDAVGGQLPAVFERDRESGVVVAVGESLVVRSDVHDPSVDELRTRLSDLVAGHLQ